MEIYMYQRPRGEELIVENEKVYDYMCENVLTELRFGLLMHINDYEWHHNTGDGCLENVYKTIEEANKYRKVYPAPEDDRNDCWSDFPVEVTIFKEDKKNKIKIFVLNDDTPIFDILSPEQISKLIPFP